MEKQPKEITVCTLQCVLMPQGEIICKGKTIGWFKDVKESLKSQQDSDALLDACEAIIALESSSEPLGHNNMENSEPNKCPLCMVLRQVEKAIAKQKK